MRLKKWDGFWTFRHLFPALGRARPERLGAGQGGCRGMNLSPASQTFGKLRRKRDCGHHTPPAPETTAPPTHEPTVTGSRLSFVDLPRGHRTLWGRLRAQRGSSPGDNAAGCRDWARRSGAPAASPGTTRWTRQDWGPSGAPDDSAPQTLELTAARPGSGHGRLRPAPVSHIHHFVASGVPPESSLGPPRPVPRLA